MAPEAATSSRPLRSHLELFRSTLATAGDRLQRSMALETATGSHPSGGTGSIAFQFRTGSIHPHDSLLAAIEQFSNNASGCCCGGGSRSKPETNPPPGCDSGFAVFGLTHRVDKTLGAATQHRLADGHGALGGNGCLALPGGAALVALGLGCFLLRDGHCA